MSVDHTSGYFWQYAGQYNKLSENLAVSSKFNLSFKDELDLEMYYLAIGSKEASELDDVLGQVEDAQNIMEEAASEYISCQWGEVSEQSGCLSG